MVLTGQIPVESAPPAATRARCSDDHIIYGQPSLSSSSNSGNGSSSASADRCRELAIASSGVVLKPNDSDSSGSRKLLAASGGASPQPRVDPGTSVGFETPAASRCGQEGAGPPTATYAPQEADDAGDELPSRGSALHHVNGCKPCLYVNQVVGCRDGRDCSFCHFYHSIKNTPKMSKTKRDRFRKSLATDADGDDTGELKPRQAGLVVRSPGDGSPTGGAASSGPGASSSSCAAPSGSMMMSL